jgi:hypothetical protein
LNPTEDVIPPLFDFFAVRPSSSTEATMTAEEEQKDKPEECSTPLEDYQSVSTPSPDESASALPGEK